MKRLLSFMLLLASAASLDAQQIIEQKIIATDGYCGWPTVCRLESGELKVVYSGDREFHVDPWGKVREITSSDNGDTWSEPHTLQNSLLDDRDAGLIELKDGTQMLYWFNSLAWLDLMEKGKIWDGLRNIDIDGSIIRHRQKLPAREELEKLCGVFSCVSEDGGKTWSEPARLVGSAPHGGIELKCGTILHAGCAYDNKMHAQGIVVEKYNRRKGSWKLVTWLEFEEGLDYKNCFEPHLAENPDGSLLLMCRYQGKGSGEHMIQCESHDKGKTWSKLHRSELYGYPPHFLNLPDGRLLVTYARRQAPDFGQYAAISADGGATWGPEMLLARGVDADNGYPSTVQMGDGSFLTVYYARPQKGQPCAIMSVRWILD